MTSATAEADLFPNKRKVSGAYETSFNPKEYLREYYAGIGPENHELLRFFADMTAAVPRGSVMLEFGGGPTIYQLISAARHAREIHFCDYLQANLEAVQTWVDGHRSAFDWSKFFRHALQFEGTRTPTSDQLRARQELVRERVTRFALGDAYRADPLGALYRGYYDVVSTNFTIDSITDSVSEWEQLFLNVSSLLKPGGTLLLTTLLDAEYYTIGRRVFPAVRLGEADVLARLTDSGFRDIEARVIASEAPSKAESDYKGYGGMMFVKATKGQIATDDLDRRN